MCLSSKKYTGKVNAYEIKNGAESRTHFEWAWTETMSPLRHNRHNRHIGLVVPHNGIDDSSHLFVTWPMMFMERSTSEAFSYNMP